MRLLSSSTLFLVLALALLGCSALAGGLAIATERAVAADETGEETPTTSEEPPPEVETPTEPETTTPEPETPTTAPPVTTPPVAAPSGDGGGAPVEAPKSTPSAGAGATGGGSAGGGDSGGSSSSGSAASGSASTGTTTTAPATAPSRHTTRTQSHKPAAGGDSGAGDRDSQVAAGGTDGRDGGDGRDATAPSGGAPAPQPTVSSQAFDAGATAVTDAASHVGEAFAEALPAAPLKKIGDQVAAHIAATDSAASGEQRKQAADGIGTALGAALLGSAVAVDRTAATSGSPTPFFDSPGGGSGTVYLVVLALLLLGVAALVLRETRLALGLGAPRTGTRVGDGSRPTALVERIGVALAALRDGLDHWFGRFRRLRANAAAGLRSLF